MVSAPDRVFRVRIELGGQPLVLRMVGADEAAVLGQLRADFASPDICTYTTEQAGGATSQLHVRWRKVATITPPGDRAAGVGKPLAAGKCRWVGLGSASPVTPGTLPSPHRAPTPRTAGDEDKPSPTQSVQHLHW